MQKTQLAAALVAALGVTVSGVAYAADSNESGMAVTEQSTVKTETKKTKKSGAPKLAKKGKEGSCKGKEGSCKGKEGSCKGKDDSCKDKEDSCKGKEHSCKGKEHKKATKKETKETQTETTTETK